MSEFEEYIKTTKGQSGFSFKLWENIKPFHILILGALFFLGNKLYSTDQSKTVLIGGGVIVLIYLFSLSRPGSVRKAIPRAIAVRLAHEDLKKEIGPHSSYPTGTKIYPTGYFKDQSWDQGDGMQLFKYNIGFKVSEPNKSEKEIIYQMNPYTGESKGIVEAPLGFRGDKVKDLQTIIPQMIKVDDKPKV